MDGHCYRFSTEQKFDEIEFVANFQSEHVREYGTRLITRTKERTEKLGLTF